MDHPHSCFLMPKIYLWPASLFWVSSRDSTGSLFQQVVAVIGIPGKAYSTTVLSPPNPQTPHSHILSTVKMCSWRPNCIPYLALQNAEKAAPQFSITVLQENPLNVGIICVSKYFFIYIEWRCFPWTPPRGIRVCEHQWGRQWTSKSRHLVRFSATSASTFECLSSYCELL